MTQPAIATIADTWRTRFSGRLLTSSDGEYTLARRLWNGMVDRRPSLIACCATPEDVRTGLKLARSVGLPISVRGGGHSVAGNAICDDGLMIDLSAMKGIQVNAASREAVAGPGVLWGEFDATTEVHGLARRAVRFHTRASPVLRSAAASDI
jgi:FAD/FMN-containing dehydrogenase